MVEEFFARWGQVSAGALLVFILYMMFTDRLVWKKSHEKAYTLARELADEKFIEMKAHYEQRILDLKEMQSGVITDLRATNDTQGRALGVSVDNVQRLVSQQDELLDLARTAVPALGAQRAAIEANRGQG